MMFFGWPLGALGWWGLAFLVFAVVASRDLNPNLTGLGMLALILGLACALYGFRRRLLMHDGFLVQRIGFAEQRWKWSEMSAIMLDHTRFGRPVISFEVRGVGQIYLCGPWNVDEMTVHTAIRLAKLRWGQGAANWRRARPPPMCLGQGRSGSIPCL